ncbi:hypothetical protein [Bosea sp. (in: a-proteobacteria)]|uniref:hypothetical protein n=1 Tax=Bosea sp. (in: a-proteobacteria) TaxID=1871050 RepID=UPI002733EA2E|nr:hypothetical protein [Bosea sp. (in: a-proteobacteria)]MDP3410965.1 hypothetical protein [Bosea sp. (in: a-proteobacteria)]
MSRATTIGLGLLAALLLTPLTPVEAEAAGAAARPSATASKAIGSGASGIHQVSRNRWGGADGHRIRGHRHAYGHGHGSVRLGALGYPGPSTNPVSARSSHRLSDPGLEPERAIDRRSFEHMPVRIGIVRGPTPEPTLYRLEGRRDRPATRVIRINDPEPRDGRRSRFAHAETGALLLIVPGR